MPDTPELQVQPRPKDPFAAPPPGAPSLTPTPEGAAGGDGAGATGPRPDVNGAAEVLDHYAEPTEKGGGPAQAGGGTSKLEDFRALLDKPRLKDKEALAAWDKVEDKSAADEDLVALAIARLAPAAAHRVLKESGKGFTAAIVDAIVKKKGAWGSELLPQVEEISTCGDSEPKARLREVIRPGSSRGIVKYGYKPRLGDSLGAGRTLALGKPAEVMVKDEGWLKFHASFPGVPTPHFRWKLTVDEAAFGPAPAATEGADASSPTATYTLQPKKAGAAQITADLTVFETSGYIGKDSHTYTLNVIDAVADPGGYFEGRFQETFAEIMNAGPFKDLKDKKDGIAGLFSKEQQELLLGYMDTKIVPPGLFTNEANNKANGPQRVLIASNMLTHGKIKLGDQEMDGQKWCASCCGGWVNGVWAYAGTNAAIGYGSLSSEQSISPTGEKSYGSGKQASVKGGNVTSEGVRAVLSKEAGLKGAVEKAKSKVQDAKKKKDPDAEATAQSELAAAEADLASKMPALKDEEAKKKVEVGASTTGTGHTPMQFDFLMTELRTGDWIYLDNGGAAGHSVLFVDWAGDEESGSDTAPEIGQTRTVRWRKAHCYNQRKPELGGTYDTFRIGFPYSDACNVNAVYAITHAREDAQVASTPEQFLAYDVDAAVASNRKILENAKSSLDAAAVKRKLLGVVQGVVAGMKDKKRKADTVGKVAGGFSAPQQKVVDGILGGSDDNERDIANLVALGQKLSVIDITHGDPTHPNGKLDQKMSAGSWSPPWPAWSGDASLKKQAQ